MSTQILILLTSILLSFSSGVVFGQVASFAPRLVSSKKQTKSSKEVFHDDGKLDENEPEIDANGIQDDKEMKKRAEDARTSKDNRQDSDLSLLIIPINYGLLLPTKIGGSVSWIYSEDMSFDAEYLRASIGLGWAGMSLIDFSEIVATIKVRYYFGNSFNLVAGLGQRSYHFNLDGSLLSAISESSPPSATLLKIENEILTLGVGNRWQFDNGITLGFDWFELIATIGQGSARTQLLDYIKSEDDRKNVEDLIKYMRYGPTFNILKILIGYTF